jgi:hypothetical protein
VLPHWFTPHSVLIGRAGGYLSGCPRIPNRLADGPGRDHPRSVRLAIDACLAFILRSAVHSISLHSLRFIRLLDINGASGIAAKGPSKSPSIVICVQRIPRPPIQTRG